MFLCRQLIFFRGQHGTYTHFPQAYFFYPHSCELIVDKMRVYWVLIHRSVNWKLAFIFNLLGKK